MRDTAPSPWTSEEGREFLQGRIGDFARTLFWIAAGFWLIGWGLAVAFPSPSVPFSALGGVQLINLGIAALYLIEWRLMRRAPLPLVVVLSVDACGTLLGGVFESLIAASLPSPLRPELIALLGLLGILLYRSAIVPGDARRAFWLGAGAAAPLPFVTYGIYARADPATLAGAPLAYAAWTFVFCVFAVLLSTMIARVIYGLRQKVSEARRLGQYTLEEKIGEGGMGAVYRASHALLRRPTAIKLLPPERAGQMDLVRFEREVQMTSLLASPNTVSVYDYGRTPDGIFYYAMEYLDGIDLDELVRRDGPMPPARAAHVLAQVCRALEEAHGVGLIHRDIKPANILLCHRGGTPDMAKVVDFGLVKDLQARRDGVTLENMVLGTPHYMAPEAISSPERLDARSDLYALGAVGYFLLTGKVVFEGETAMDVFAQHLREAPVSPSARLGRPLPAGFESLLLAALSKQPEARPPSARAFREALSACADVPPWTETAAAAWWRERGERLKRARAGEPTVPSEERTLVVDVGPDRATGHVGRLRP